MAIALAPDVKKQALSSIKQYVAQHLDQDLGDLQAGLLLDYFLKELAPSVYNQAIQDAQHYFQERASDLEGVCFEREFGYWSDTARGGRQKSG
jgi:uncharacterized protein (DUF2164 family)